MTSSTYTKQTTGSVAEVIESDDSEVKIIQDGMQMTLENAIDALRKLRVLDN